jgi:23S rRNA C2498 (ribose-2'-O)-methylase RlmM
MIYIYAQLKTNVVINENIHEQDRITAKNTVIDGLCQSEWLHAADTHMAKKASTECQRFFVQLVKLLKCELLIVI